MSASTICAAWRATVADRNRLCRGGAASTPSRSTRKPALKVDEHNIGYMPIARTPPRNAAAQGRSRSQNVNEAYFPLRRDRTADDPGVMSNRRFHAMNKWPLESDLPGFRGNMLDLHEHASGRLCQKLVKLYAWRSTCRDHFDRYFAKPHMILRMSRYP